MIAADIPDVIQLWYDTPGMGLNDADDSPESIRRFIDSNPTTCFVAEEDSLLIGCVLCGHDGRRATIYHLAVHPDARRQGVGRKLVDACMSAMSDENITKARLYVFATNETGNAFWESIGFTARDDLVLRNKNICTDSDC
ncbi:N-acetyltransferase [Clostridia bacterium]|nr:N-acetyltransferase [Clostridia bacterium]